MKRFLFIVALALVCIGQGFGPKIVRGPMPSVLANGAPSFYGVEYMWVSSDLPDGVVSNVWLDRIQSRKLQTNGSPNTLTKDANGINFDGTTQHNQLTNGGNIALSPWTTNYAMGFIVLYSPPGGGGGDGMPLYGRPADSSTYMTYGGSSKWKVWQYTAGAQVNGIPTNEWCDILFFTTNSAATVYSEVWTNGVLSKRRDANLEQDRMMVDFGYITNLTGVGTFKGKLREIVIQTNMIAVSASNAAFTLHYRRTNTYGGSP